MSKSGADDAHVSNAPARPRIGKLANLKKRDYWVGDPEDIFHIDWLAEWNELKNLDPLPEDAASES